VTRTPWRRAVGAEARLTVCHPGMLHDARARAVQDMPDVDVSLGLSEETFEPTLKKYPVGGRPAPCKPYAWAGLRIAGGVCPGGAEPLTWSVRRSRRA